MPDRKRLGLERPADLLSKLRWEIDQVMVPTDHGAVASYRAFNCAVTAWSICDWVWNAAAPDPRGTLPAESPNPNANGSEPLASLLRDQCRELAICQQLANGSKHFTLDRYNDETLSSYRSRGVHVDCSEDGKRRLVPAYGVLIVDGERIYNDILLFTVACNYWIGFFKRYGIK